MIRKIITIQNCRDIINSIIEPPNKLIGILTHFKLCLAVAIHNFKWVKIIQIWQKGDQGFRNLVDWCHVLAWTYLRADI